MNDRGKGLHDQSMWGYYQNIAPEVFGGAKPRLEYLLSRIKKLTKKESPRVLNIGSGSGYFEEQALAKGWKICAIDPNQETISNLKAKGVESICGYAESMPFESDAFDFVVASELLEHLSHSDRVEALQEIYRVLRPKGCLIGTVPYKENLDQNIVYCPNCKSVFHRWGHEVSFDVDSFQAEIKPVFDQVDIRVMAYNSYRGLSFYDLVDTLARYILAKIRMPISSTSIFFIAKKH
jgi:SAM-dependent methyltransferase